MMNGFYGLWFREPAADWTYALPIGNGHMGAMIYGGIQNEIITLNEDTIWDGTRCDRNNPNALENLQRMREAIFAGRYDNAEEIGKDMLGIPNTLNSFQPACTLKLSFNQTGIFSEYSRALDIENAVHTVTYRPPHGRSDRPCERESFISTPDDIMVMRISHELRGGLTFDVALSRFSQAEVKCESAAISLSGRCREGGVGFTTLVEITVDNGEILNMGNFLRVTCANTAELRIACATDYAGGDPMEKCKNTLQKAADKPYELLRERHIANYRSLYARQRFSLNGRPDKKSTDELIAEYDNDCGATVCELWYNYLRYMLISSSRPGGKPSNLQGVWNDAMEAPWNSDYHPNVNMQINYWPAEGYALPECVEPLVDWLCDLVPYGEKTARVHYGARGWVMHHISDIFGCTTPMDGPWGIWPFGGAWLSRHLYERYLYGGDKVFLRNTALPVIEGAALFFLDFLIECPKGIAGEGQLVTCPSHSPENRFRAPNGEISWLTYASTMDMEIIHDLFTIYLESLSILSIRGEYEDEVRSALARLVPMAVSERTGGIREWIEDYDEIEPGHRHVSQLFALYPGRQITSQHPELINACRKTLERRLSNQYDGQGWSYGWIATLFARLYDGDSSLDMIGRIAKKLTMPNLMVNAHGNPQAGDAQAVPAAIQEMLAQSHTGVIELAPALPKAWKSGAMEGLPVRGGHVLNLYWTDGRLNRAELEAGWHSDVKLKTNLTSVVSTDGSPVAKNESGIISFNAVKGHKYIII